MQVDEKQAVVEGWRIIQLITGNCLLLAKCQCGNAMHVAVSSADNSNPLIRGLIADVNQEWNPTGLMTHKPHGTKNVYNHEH